MWLWLFVASCLAGAHAVSVGDPCTTTDNGRGVCKRLNDCPALLAKSQRQPISRTDSDDLRASNRKCPVAYIKNNPGVCCKLNTNTGWTNEPECGLVDTPKIFGGTLTRIGEFPWMVLLGYSTGSRIDFMCGGSLINKRWVLTAAHCILNNLRVVRLGEHNLTTNPDCEIDEDEDEFCYPDHVDVDVLHSIKHPHFFQPIIDNDIALVELKTPIASYTEEIRPICLPVGELGRMDLERKKMVVAGWGRTETDYHGSSELLKTQVPVATRSSCNIAYKRLSRGAKSISKKQMCAGGERGQDSCNGDSGGPLMMCTSIGGRNPWTQFGIVSYGPLKCGSQGVPGVYTRVSEYLGWIGSVTRD